jgi:hypothetical protein
VVRSELGRRAQPLLTRPVPRSAPRNPALLLLVAFRQRPSLVSLGSLARCTNRAGGLGLRPTRPRARCPPTRAHSPAGSLPTRPRPLAGLPGSPATCRFPPAAVTCLTLGHLRVAATEPAAWACARSPAGSLPTRPPPLAGLSGSPPSVARGARAAPQRPASDVCPAQLCCHLQLPVNPRPLGSPE